MTQLKSFTTMEKRTNPYFIYKLTSELTISCDDYKDKNRYEIVYIIDDLGKDKNTGYIYDKELKMHFESPNSIHQFFEVETKYITLHLEPSLKKSENFNRKLFYRYDFMKLKVKGNGQVVNVMNADELKRTWIKLRAKIQEDHKGNLIDNYLLKVDQEMNICDKYLPPISQYYHMGLLFPRIPLQHNSKWMGERIIEFSPYEKEKFKEYTAVSHTENDIVYYGINGEKMSESNTILTKYEGTVTKKENQFLPIKALVNTVTERNGLITEWNFKLDKL